MQAPKSIFSQYDYIENKVFKRILKTYYDSVKERRPSKIVRNEMLQNVKSELRKAARFWLVTQGDSEEWRIGLE